MEGSDVLLTICQVAIAFAGFTSIVGVVGQQDDRHWDREDSFRLWLMIESSLACLLFSLLPFVLYHLEIESRTTWTASSAAMAAFLVVHMAVVTPWLLKIKKVEGWSTLRFEPVIAVTILSTLAVQSLNALGFGFERTFGAYLLGLILFLGLASMHFVALLVAVNASGGRRDE